MNGSEENTQIPKNIYETKYRTENGIKIFIVDGKKVREQYDMDFIAGGHYYRYKFIPEDEVWIDDAMNIDEIEPTILHELTERTLMKEQSMSYPKAHDIANQKELEVRKERNDIRDKINTILYTNLPEQTELKLLILISAMNKLAHFDFLRDRIEVERKSYAKFSVQPVVQIEIPFKDLKDKSASKVLIDMFSKLNNLEIKDKTFGIRIMPLDF